MDAMWQLTRSALFMEHCKILSPWTNLDRVFFRKVCSFYGALQVPLFLPGDAVFFAAIPPGYHLTRAEFAGLRNLAVTVAARKYPVGSQSSSSLGRLASCEGILLAIALTHAVRLIQYLDRPGFIGILPVPSSKRRKVRCSRSRGRFLHAQDHAETDVRISR